MDGTESATVDTAHNSTDYGYYSMRSTESTTVISAENSTEYDFYSISGRASFLFSQPYYIVALTFSTLAIVANVTSLAAIYHIRKSMPSHFRILISLLASDLVIDFSFMGHISNAVINPRSEPGYGSWQERLTSKCSYMVIKALNNTGLNITLLNLMAMAIDHYIAILTPFKKMRLMSKRRTTIMIVIIWAIAILAGFSDFFSPVAGVPSAQQSHNATELNFCELMWVTSYQEEFIMFGIVVVCLLSMLYMYLHIYCEIKGKHKTDTANMLKTHRNKRALITTMLILGTFVVCWLPICTFNVVLIIIIRGGWADDIQQSMMPVLTKVDRYLYDLMLLNTLCDPIIYTIRMHEVRRGYFLMFNRCFTLDSRFSHMLWDNSRRHSMSYTYDDTVRRAMLARGRGCRDEEEEEEDAIDDNGRLEANGKQ